MSSKEAKIFISYSRADSDFALKLGKDLRAARANIWIDEVNIKKGERWDRAIQKALGDCDSLIVILSNAAMDSENVIDEINFFISKEKQILPVLYEDCEVYYRLERFQRTDFTNNYDTGLKQLCRALEISLPAQELKKMPNKTEPRQKRTTTAASPAKVSPGPAGPKIKLRATPITDLSEVAVKKMLAEKGFYDSERNKNGRGFANQFQLVERQGESLIIDENSGLTWQQSGFSADLTFEQAQDYTNELNRNNHAGYTDWRLPTLEEAMSLVEPTENLQDGFYINPIFNKKQNWIWTGDKKSASRAWIVNFVVGRCVIIDGNDGHVRAVR